MYKISFYVLPSHLEQVKAAMFEVGAGRIGNYERCAWQSAGTGQYQPLPEADPYSGTEGQLESAEEYLVEMVCEDQLIDKVIDALLEAHPYETPAYSAWPIYNGKKANG